MTMSKEIIENSKKQFCELLRLINRDNANIEGLISKLESSDFFIAPASTKYHNSVEGGLVDHSLNVYFNLKSLVEHKHLNDVIPEESIIICGLLHDISKMDLYEKTARNVKVYSKYGSKKDELGTFDWQAVMGYKTKDIENRFIYGNHEETSEFMIRCYIPLHIEESVAILNHHCTLNYDSVSIESVSPKYKRYPLACLLHLADMISTFIDEKVVDDE